MEVNIACIEDEKESQEQLKTLLFDYAKEKKLTVNLSFFGSAEAFLAQDTSSYKIIFMDIELPGINGMQAAKKLRQSNESSSLVFVTRIAQFAIDGYDVGALNYILKPLSYPELKMTMEKIFRYHDMMNFIMLNDGKQMTKVNLDSLLYVESSGHQLIYHLINTTIQVRERPLKDVGKELAPYNFAFCSVSYLVNLKYCEKIVGDDLYIGKEVIKITRTKKKEFLNAMADYMARYGV